jgi:5-methyltetrahydrofolate--homocysteine methyltransferase
MPARTSSALNCGTGMDMPQRPRGDRALPADDPPCRHGQPKAGQPKLIDMKVVYDETPQQMVKGVRADAGGGTNILGACCGSTPDHIRAFRRRSTLT